ncbi:glycerate kinase [Psychrobacter sp.]|uniref:glycerate kinase n=1 Tax=Psychrobacter sp. TaxID=56811 RepID=UPI002648F7F1|nr:glycerate kinase [Psychrobacter sp.]MDN6276444.1 glycerate kinase [Psychrobacter sp.]MDN6308517.1 glycerate kinase [Psychrobacter sp.]
MKILIAPDSFKESLEALDVCQAIQSGFNQVFPDADYTLLPMADGGEGTSDVLSYTLGGHWKEVVVNDPLMRPITAKYLLLPDATAVIEIAQACGLHLLTSAERNPVVASSYGVGELIVDALDEGAKRIIIGLGGSATNDAGHGMLTALGMSFYDSDNHTLSQGGGELARLHKIDGKSFHLKVLNTVFEVACDVTNPLCGQQGASAIFGPQKGASATQVAALDDALNHFANICDKSGYQDCREVEGAGAAGGLGYALMSFFGAQLKSGFHTVAEAANLAEHIAHADLVVTGEGKLDAQTAMGKVAGSISQIAKAAHTPVVAICGSVDELTPTQINQFDIIMPSIQKADTIEKILGQAHNNVEITARNIAKAIRLGQCLK